MLNISLQRMQSVWSKILIASLRGVSGLTVAALWSRAVGYEMHPAFFFCQFVCSDNVS